MDLSSIGKVTKYANVSHLTVKKREAVVTDKGQ